MGFILFLKIDRMLEYGVLLCNMRKYGIILNTLVLYHSKSTTVMIYLMAVMWQHQLCND
jgi:hypothetical protein